MKTLIYVAVARATTTQLTHLLCVCPPEEQLFSPRVLVKKKKKCRFSFPISPTKNNKKKGTLFLFFLLAIRFPAAHSALVKSSGLLSGALSQISLPVNPSQGPTNLRTPAETPSGAERRRHLPWLPLIADDWNKVVFGMITCQNCWQKGCRSWRCLEKLRPL